MMEQFKQMRVLQMQGDRILVTAFPKNDAAALQQELTALGMIEAQVAGNTVTGRVPVDALSQIARASNLRQLRPVLVTRRGGLTTTHGLTLPRVALSCSADHRHRLDLDQPLRPHQPAHEHERTARRTGIAHAPWPGRAQSSQPSRGARNTSHCTQESIGSNVPSSRGAPGTWQ